MTNWFGLAYWGLVFLFSVSLRVVPDKRAQWFGVLNMAALWVFTGGIAAGTALAYAFLLWLLIRTAVQTRIMVFAALALPLLLFAGYKAVQDVEPTAVWFKSLGPYSESSLKILRMLSFSYVALRSADAVHCIVIKKMSLIQPLAMVGFLFPFHSLLSGPVNRYDEHQKMDRLGGLIGERLFLEAVNDVVTGMLYKYVAADYLRVVWFGTGPMLSLGVVDTGVIFVYIFFDFAGYSRMALGAGKWMGVPTPVNFNAPYWAATITDFFTRWHISLGAFIQRNLYIPVQISLARKWGAKHSYWAGLIALVVSWVFVGLWHRFSLLFMLYGLIMALVVYLEKVVRNWMQKRKWHQNARLLLLSKYLGPVYVFVTVTLLIHLVIAEIIK